MYPLSFYHYLTFAISYISLNTIYHNVDSILNLIFTSSFQRLEEKRKHKFRLLVLSLINAILATAFCGYQLLTSTNISMCVYLAVFIVAYFMHDMYQSRHTWLKHPVDVVHHILGILIIGIGIYQDSLLRFAPHFGIVEISTIPLDIALMMRELYGEKGIIFSISSKLFAISFFSSRIVWMTFVIVNHLFLNEEVSEILSKVGILKYGIIAVLLLQFYWFIKIVQKFVMPSESEKEKKM